eukprot:1902019-Pyramimonas_sp.AAC.1
MQTWRRHRRGARLRGIFEEDGSPRAYGPLWGGVFAAAEEDATMWVYLLEHCQSVRGFSDAFEWNLGRRDS